MSNSEEEEIARDYICFEKPDVTVIVVDATCLERNLNLVYQTMEITDNIIVCVNLLDEAKSKGINIDLDKLSSLLGCPVVGTIAKKKKTLNNLISTIYKVCEKKISILPSKPKYNKLIDGEKTILNSIGNHLNIDITTNENINIKLNNVLGNLEQENINKSNFKNVIISSIVTKAEKISKEVCRFTRSSESKRDIKIDKILTSKKFGIPIMILFLGVIFWITIIGANYPSELILICLHFFRKN